MKTFLFFLFSISFHFVFAVQTPKEYAKNKHVKLSCEIVSGKYILNYSFKDDIEKLRTFTLMMPVDKTIKDISKFGVPKQLYKAYIPKKSVIRKRNRIIKNGLYKTIGDILRPDYNAVVEYYSNYTQSIASQLMQILINENRDNRKNRIEIAMKFVQDIPYGIPEIADSTWETSGVFSPPEVFIKMYGDCDSKAILFASLLKNLINANDVLFLFTSDKHALTAIKGIPIKGQVYITYNSDYYIVADTSGPERLSWGEDGNNNFTTTAYKIEKLNLKN